MQADHRFSTSLIKMRIHQPFACSFTHDLYSCYLFARSFSALFDEEFLQISKGFGL